MRTLSWQVSPQEFCVIIGDKDLLRNRSRLQLSTHACRALWGMCCCRHPRKCPMSPIPRVRDPCQGLTAATREGVVTGGAQVSRSPVCAVSPLGGLGPRQKFLRRSGSTWQTLALVRGGGHGPGCVSEPGETSPCCRHSPIWPRREPPRESLISPHVWLPAPPVLSNQRSAASGNPAPQGGGRICPIAAAAPTRAAVTHVSPGFGPPSRPVPPARGVFGLCPTEHRERGSGQRRPKVREGPFPPQGLLAAPRKSSAARAATPPCRDLRALPLQSLVLNQHRHRRSEQPVCASSAFHPAGEMLPAKGK